MSLKTINVLLVEDNPDQRDLTLYAFSTSNPNINVTVTDNGLSCLEALSKQSYDAIILDYSLPRMNGLEVLSHIQERGYTLPVIIVTGQGDETIAVEAMKHGAYDYIIKSGNYYDTLPLVLARVLEKYTLRQKIEASSKRSRLLFEVSLLITKKQKVSHISETLLSGACELLQSQGGMLLLINPNTGHLELAACTKNSTDICTLLAAHCNWPSLLSTFKEKHAVTLNQHTLNELLTISLANLADLHYFLAVPINIYGDFGGAILVWNKCGHEDFLSEDADALSTLSLHAGVAIENARFIEDMEQQAISDSLTGLYNHREFQKRLGEEIDRAKRYQKVFSLLLLDVDHFKALNDTYGHLVGDFVLKSISSIFHQSIRDVDIAARYGGEEFAIILPETPEDGAAVVAERIRNAVDTMPFKLDDGKVISSSISIGIASFPQASQTRESLISAADQALYYAKNAGRNRLCRFSEIPT